MRSSLERASPSSAHALQISHTVFETLPLSWSALAQRTWREAMDDDILGLAAQLAYYLFLALFPAILFLLALASFFPLSNITDDVARSIGPFVSPQVLELIQDQMRRLGEGDSGGLLTFGVAGALWSSSAAMVSIVGALNKAYDIEEARPWWKVRLVSIGLTVGASLFVLVAFSLVLIGPTLAEWLGDVTGWGRAFEWTWLILQWPLVFALVAIGIGLIYYFGPDAEQDWVWITPGGRGHRPLDPRLASLQAVHRQVHRLRGGLRKRGRRHRAATVVLRLGDSDSRGCGDERRNRACLAAWEGTRAKDRARETVAWCPRRARVPRSPGA